MRLIPACLVLGLLLAPLAGLAQTTSADTDGDGIPDSVEAAEGRNPSVKDNDVFTVPRLFAMQQYRDFFAREGDAGGINYWAGQISSGAMTRAKVAETFIRSGESATSLSLTRLYFAYFLRAPDAGGMNYWLGVAAEGNSLARISDLFAQSTEFKVRYGGMSHAQFVTLVYRNVLNREPDTEGFNYWMNLLNNNKVNWGQVMLAFSDSAENQALTGNRSIVALVYTRMLRRTPDDASFSYWTRYLDTGNPLVNFLQQVIDTAEYRARFLP